MHLRRTGPEADLDRHYRVEIVPGLCGDWGRLGRSGRSRTDRFDTKAEAKDARCARHFRKAKRDYASGTGRRIMRANESVGPG